MRIARWYNNRDIRIEEIPTPVISTGELLVRVEACGICGSDVMEWYRLDRAPLVLGHEISGQVAAVGDEIEHYKEGDRITAAHHVPCNNCHYCLNQHQTTCNTLRQTNFDPGGFAEFIRLSAINVERGVFKLPDIVSFEEGTFVEPLACVIRGQKRVKMPPASSVLVIGSGIAGLLHIQLAQVLGAKQVIALDISPYRLQAAQNFGANFTINAKGYIPNQIRQINHGLLADLVIICTSAKLATINALKSVERGGTILFFAPTDPGIVIPISINDLFWRNDITLTTSYAGSPADYQEALELIRTGTIAVSKMITHRLGLAEISKGFKLVTEAHDSLKVIIEPQR